MAILPASRSPGLLTGSSLLDEEIPALAAKGVEVHTVVHRDIGKRSPDLLRHCMPTLRNTRHALTTAVRMTRRNAWKAIPAPSLRERLRMASVQSAIATVAKKEQVDLIHSHWARPVGTCASLARDLTGLPLVVTLRGVDVFREDSIGYGCTRDPWYVRRLHHGLDRADKIIGVSSQIIERAVELGADRSKTIVIPKGVHHTHFIPGDRREARERLGLESRPTILFVGALGPWKGIPDLLEAFLLVKRESPFAQLVVCGKGELAADIGEFIKEHELHRDVILAGYIGRSELPLYFQAADVFVLPSLTEGSGNVILEAAACGRPAVGTRVGGIPDYIVDGETGLLCEKQNPGDLADKLTQLLEDPKRATEMGLAGRQRVEENFRYEQMIDRRSRS